MTLTWPLGGNELARVMSSSNSIPVVFADADAFAEPDGPAFPLAALQSLAAALTHVPVQQLTNNRLPPRLSAEQDGELPAPLQTLLNTFCPLLLFKARPLQVAVYRLLEKYENVFFFFFKMLCSSIKKQLGGLVAECPPRGR